MGWLGCCGVLQNSAVSWEIHRCMGKEGELPSHTSRAGSLIPGMGLVCEGQQPMVLVVSRFRQSMVVGIHKVLSLI